MLSEQCVIRRPAMRTRSRSILLTQYANLFIGPRRKKGALERLSEVTVRQRGDVYLFVYGILECLPCLESRGIRRSDLNGLSRAGVASLPSSTCLNGESAKTHQ